MKRLGVVSLVLGLVFNPLGVGLALHLAGRRPALFPEEAVLVLAVTSILFSLAGALLLRSERFRLILGRFVLVGVSAGVGCLGLEAFLQIRTLGQIRIVRSPEYHHNYEPNANGISENGTGEVRDRVLVHTNALGMRGPLPPPFAESDSRLRVLLLGDSFVQADELPFEATMGQRLAGILGPDRVVIQHGIASWSPILELNWLVKSWDPVRPDQVLLFLCVNDFYAEDTHYGDPYYRTQAVLDEDGIPERFDLGSDPANLPGFIKRLTFPELRRVVRNVGGALRVAGSNTHLITPEAVDSLLTASPDEFETLVQARVPDGPAKGILVETLRLARPDSVWSASTRQNVDETMESIRVMDRFLSEHGSRLVLTFAPFGWGIAPYEAVPGKNRWGLADQTMLVSAGIQNHVREFADSMGLSFVDLSPVLAEAARPDSALYFPRDGHWNARGHSVVAGALAALFSDRRFSAPPGEAHVGPGTSP